MTKLVKLIHIQIDRKPYQVSENSASGAYLRKLAGITDEYDLWQRAKGNEDDILITPEMSIRLKNGDHFYTAKKIITPGDVNDRN